MIENRQPDERVEALIAAARSGDDGAFDRLVRRYYARIHRWALARTGDPDDADDVVQGTLVRLYSGLSGYDGRAAFTTWLYQVVRSAAADLYRRRARRDRLADRVAQEQKSGGSTAPTGPRLDETRAVDLVKTYCDELSDRQRQAFDLVDLQGLAAVEAAELLGVDPATVRTHVFRARRAIRSRILENHPELMEGYGS